LVGNVGRLSDQKNQHVLFKAISELDNNVHLAIAGEGELREKLDEYANKLQVSDRVHLIGEIEYDKIPIFFTSIDIFAMPSKFEGLSNALIEAMSFSLPVICSSIDAQKDVLINEQEVNSGILLEYDKPGDWAKTIAELKNDTGKYLEFKEKATLRSEDFTIERMGASFIELIEPVR
jgi:glycosyltransferase involved in cell wall biosynthesis